MGKSSIHADTFTSCHLLFLVLSHTCIGCGLWHPEAEPLGLLREDIDENADQWKEILRTPAMRREILGGVGDDDEAVVKAFAHQNREGALKTKPKVCSGPFHVSLPAMDRGASSFVCLSCESAVPLG